MELLRNLLSLFSRSAADNFSTAIVSLSVQADLAPSLGYINALLEQDSAANLRYGVLFILALSSLGVYSIILAG